MKILTIGSPKNLVEVKQKFGETHGYSLAGDRVSAKGQFENIELIFDFVAYENYKSVNIYKDSHPVVFLNTSTTSLKNLTQDLEPLIFGFCGMPTFLNREILEVVIGNERQQAKLDEVCDKLKTKYSVVADRVGMVTPRVICMIINEAYYTVEEGTATREDIDLAMKLGTNYPYGPFEWASRIGLKNVCQLLEAVHCETKDTRYKICALLREESLLN